MKKVVTFLAFAVTCFSVSSLLWGEEGLVREFSNEVAIDQDDMTLWVNKKNPDGSLMISSDKKSGFVFSYHISGRLLEKIYLGKPGNIDVAYDVKTSRGTFDFVLVNERKTDRLAIFRVNPLSLKMELIGKDIYVGGNYGSATYVDPSGKLYSLIVTKSGVVKQFLIHLEEQAAPYATLARKWELKSQAEGMVVDPITNKIFIAEEDVGIWVFPAEPYLEPVGNLIAEVGDFGIESDLEGLTLYHGEEETWLIASSQGASTYHVFSAAGKFEHRGLFTLPDVGETDGIMASPVAMKGYPSGIFLAHNGLNPSKIVAVNWEDLDIVLD